MTTDIERGGIDVGGSHEPSYYEIALTNRQVVVAFVILLICVVAAFFSGVWIGRESAARAQERLALLGRGNAADGANSAADKGKQEGQALQEFKFFADSRRHPDAAARVDPAAKGAAGSERPAAARVDPAAKGAAGSRSKRSTLADDLQRAGGSEAHAVASVAPRAAPGAAAASASSAAATRNRPDSAGSSATQATQATQAPAAPADDTAGEGEPLPGTPQPAPRAARSPRGKASSGTGAASASGGKSSISWSAAGASPAGTSSAAASDVVIQVFSTADKEQADKVRDGLVHAGFTAFLSPIAKGGQTMYRVRIGPFPSRTAAEPVAEKVRKERKLDTWITPNK